MFEAMLGWNKTILPNAHGQVWLDIKQQLWSVCEQTCGSNRKQECMAQKSPLLSPMFHGAYQVVPSSYAFLFLFAHLPLTRSIYLPWTLVSLVGCWLNPHFFMARQLLHHRNHVHIHLNHNLNPIKPWTKPALFIMFDAFSPLKSPCSILKSPGHSTARKTKVMGRKPRQRQLLALSQRFSFQAWSWEIIHKIYV